DYLIKNDLLSYKRKLRFKSRVKELVANQLRKELWTEERNQLLNEKIEMLFKAEVKLSEIIYSLVESFKNNSK
ncbi:MAG: hypothetical protein N2043_05045, partial [Ignavibacterium sp.]|nr:hypothetical protein [Ignavibacterium sp.]